MSGTPEPPVAVGPPATPARPPVARLAKPGSSLLVAFGAALALGLAWGNYHYLFMGFALLALVLAAWRVKPAVVEVTRSVSATRARIGDVVTVTWTVRTVGPAPSPDSGPVLLRDEVPEMFTLAGGSNVHLYWPRTGEAQFRYAMRVTRRGEYDLQPTMGSFVDPLRFRPPEVRAVGAATTLVVEPRLRPVRRIVGVRTRATLPMPDEDRAFHGLESNQFRELREYVHGDPLRRVNWKASARHSTGQRLDLMVNEYEREGRKSIWFFLDAAAYMETGTTESTSLDQSLAALLEMLSYFAERGYRIGGTVFNAHEDRTFHPEVGRRPFYLVAKFLMGVGPAAPRPRPRDAAPRTAPPAAPTGDDATETPERAATPTLPGLPAAVERSKRFLLAERPLVLVFTRPEADMERAREGVRLLRRYTVPARVSGNRAVARTPIWFVVPRISGAAARAGVAAERERLAKVQLAAGAPTPGPTRERILPVSARLAEAGAAAERASLRGLGVVMLEWEPDREPIHGLLVRGARMLATAGGTR